MEYPKSNQVGPQLSIFHPRVPVIGFVGSDAQYTLYRFGGVHSVSHFSDSEDPGFKLPLFFQKSTIGALGLKSSPEKSCMNQCMEKFEKSYSAALFGKVSDLSNDFLDASAVSPVKEAAIRSLIFIVTGFHLLTRLIKLN